MTQPARPRLLYCHCRYAQVVPTAVKDEVLRRLCEAGVPFEAVPDLCGLSARRDPGLAALAQTETVKIAACFPRAVKWLFANAGAPLPANSTQVLNMRNQTADEIVSGLLSADLHPNLPPDQKPGTPPEPTPSPSAD